MVDVINIPDNWPMPRIDLEHFTAQELQETLDVVIEEANLK